MKFYKKEGILDVTDCDFLDLKHMKKSIDGSIASKLGFSKLRMTKNQIVWYNDKAKKETFDDKNILEGKKEIK